MHWYCCQLTLLEPMQELFNQLKNDVAFSRQRPPRGIAIGRDQAMLRIGHGPASVIQVPIEYRLSPPTGFPQRDRNHLVFAGLARALRTRGRVAALGAPMRSSARWSLPIPSTARRTPRRSHLLWHPCCKRGGRGCSVLTEPP